MSMSTGDGAMGASTYVPMDLADASLVAAGEMLKTRRIFTIDRRDFDTYKLKRGHRYVAFEYIQ